MREIEVNKSLLKSLLVLASVIEARDAFTGGHIWRTSRYARLLAEKSGLTSGDVFLAQLGGLIHDLGKIGVPDTILNKRGRLTPKEYEIVKMHPAIGYRIVWDHPLGPIVARAISEHHFRPDGKGYPDNGGKGNPSLIPRIISIVDAFDAITSSRPYRGSIDLLRALAILESEKGYQFDSVFVDTFIALGHSGQLDHIVGHSSEGAMMHQCPKCGPIIAIPSSAKDGEILDCPSCKGEFRLHMHRDAFELEWTGNVADAHTPHPDLDTIEEVVRNAPEQIKLN